MLVSSFMFFYLMIHLHRKSERTDALFPYTTPVRSTGSRAVISMCRAAIRAHQRGEESERGGERGCQAGGCQNPDTDITHTYCECVGVRIFFICTLKNISKSSLACKTVLGNTLNWDRTFTLCRGSLYLKIGRAHVWTPVTRFQIVRRLMLEKKKI